MTKKLPITFRKSGDAVASYDFYDFAEGVGIKLFYIATTTNDQILTESMIYSNDIEKGNTTASSGYTILLDYDYDLSPFNMPKTLKGTAYFNYTIANESNSDVYMHVYIRKWDGTTETAIANASGAPLLNNGASDQQIVQALAVSIPNPTIIKAGEQLRISANLYGRVTGGIGAGTFGCDPMNRDGTAITPSTDNTITQFKCWIPFRIEA